MFEKGLSKNLDLVFKNLWGGLSARLKRLTLIWESILLKSYVLKILNSSILYKFLDFALLIFRLDYCIVMMYKIKYLLVNLL